MNESGHGVSGFWKGALLDFKEAIEIGEGKGPDHGLSSAVDWGSNSFPNVLQTPSGLIQPMMRLGLSGGINHHEKLGFFFGEIAKFMGHS